MIEAIRDRLDDLEDLYLSEQRLLDARAGQSEAVPLEPLLLRYGVLACGSATIDLPQL